MATWLLKVSEESSFRILDADFITQSRQQRIYLSLDLAFQPVAPVLGVPQGLRNGPQLSHDTSFLLHYLLQLQGDFMFLFYPPEVRSEHCGCGATTRNHFRV